MRIVDSITVFIVDRDPSVRLALARVMTANGHKPVCEESVESLLQKQLSDGKAVLLVDLHTSRQSETSLHEQLNARGLNLPVIYLTDGDTRYSSLQTRRLGAAGNFRKPVDNQALIDAIIFAVQQDLDKCSEGVGSTA